MSSQSLYGAKVVRLPLLPEAHDDTSVYLRADGTARSYVKFVVVVSPSVECAAIECSTK
jgi:hypothetical protein